MPVWKEIIVHHSGGRDNKGADAEAIARYHTEVRGYRDVGYHALVERVGEHFVARPGRPTSQTGAHALGRNSRALGVCLIGDFTREAPPAGQVERAAELLAEWCVRFGISPDNIYPHHKFKATICPGLVDVPSLRVKVARLLWNG